MLHSQFPRQVRKKTLNSTSWDGCFDWRWPNCASFIGASAIDRLCVVTAVQTKTELQSERLWQDYGLAFVCDELLQSDLDHLVDSVADEVPGSIERVSLASSFHPQWTKAKQSQIVHSTAPPRVWLWKECVCRTERRKRNEPGGRWTPIPAGHYSEPGNALSVGVSICFGKSRDAEEELQEEESKQKKKAPKGSGWGWEPTPAAAFPPHGAPESGVNLKNLIVTRRRDYLL